MGFKGYIISRLEVGQGWVAATFPNIIVDGQVAQVAITSCCRWSAGGATRKDEPAAETERPDSCRASGTSGNKRLNSTRRQIARACAVQRF